MEKQLDLSKVPQYVTTSWFNDGLAYGEVTLATFSHWSAPILGEGIVSLFITWDRLRHGDLWGQQWVWDTTEPTELLTPIKKQEWEDNRTKFSWKDRFFNLKNHHEQSQEALLKMIHENKTKK